MELSFIVTNNCCVINNWCVTRSVEASEDAEEAEEHDSGTSDISELRTLLYILYWFIRTENATFLVIAYKLQTVVDTCR